MCLLVVALTIPVWAEEINEERMARKGGATVTGAITEIIIDANNPATSAGLSWQAVAVAEVVNVITNPEDTYLVALPRQVAEDEELPVLVKIPAVPLSLGLGAFIDLVDICTFGLLIPSPAAKE